MSTQIGSRSTNPGPGDIDSPLFILAMDHRESFARTIYGLNEATAPAHTQKISAGKQLIYRGLLAALDRGATAGRTGVLVDERYGAGVARTARAAGLRLAMPIEQSGRPWFTLEYGTLDDASWLDHVAAFNPDYVKVLVRDNPDFDVHDRRTQQHDLAVVSAALRQQKRPLILELLVPATPQQHADVGKRYDTELRPRLTERVIRELQSAGVEPDIWKIEGLDAPADATQIVAVTQQGGRHDVRCIVLGRDAPATDLDRWLRVAAGVRGFRGFAIGRSIWEQPLMDQLAGKISEADAIGQITGNYLHYVATYEEATRSQHASSHHPQP